MREVKRFDMQGCPALIGGWVKYTDHAEAMRELDNKLGEAERRYERAEEAMREKDALAARCLRAEDAIKEMTARYEMWKEQAVNWCNAELEYRKRAERAEAQRDALLVAVKAWLNISIGLSDRIDKASPAEKGNIALEHCSVGAALRAAIASAEKGPTDEP